MQGGEGGGKEGLVDLARARQVGDVIAAVVVVALDPFPLPLSALLPLP